MRHIVRTLHNTSNNELEKYLDRKAKEGYYIISCIPVHYENPKTSNGGYLDWVVIMKI